MARKPHIHVVPRKDEGWAVIKEKSQRSSHLTDTKKEAEELARKQAKREHTEVVIHGRDGKIQDPDSYGNDPPSKKDKKH